MTAHMTNNPADYMDLPQGKTCSDCIWFKRCKSLFDCSPYNTRCDFSPSRFYYCEHTWRPGHNYCSKCGATK